MTGSNEKENVPYRLGTEQRFLSPVAIEDGIVVSRKFIEKHFGTKYNLRVLRLYRPKTDRIRARRRRARQATNRRKKH